MLRLLLAMVIVLTATASQAESLCTRAVKANDDDCGEDSVIMADSEKELDEIYQKCMREVLGDVRLREGVDFKFVVPPNKKDSVVECTEK